MKKMKLGKKNEKKMTEVKKMKKNDSGQPVYALNVPVD